MLDMKYKIVEDFKKTMEKHMPDRVSLIKSKRTYAYKIQKKFRFKPALQSSHLGILYNKNKKEWTAKDYKEAIEVIDYYRNKPEYKIPDYKVKLPKKHNLFAKSFKSKGYRN
jgi:hypothetical protein